MSRRSLSTPILLAIVMLALLAILTVGWVLVIVVGAKEAAWPGVYWALLAVGATFIVLLIVGVVLYLILSIKAINLTSLQSNFIDSVTHELKSPIASMKLYLQTLSRHQVDQQLQVDFHRFMLEDLERLDHLINQMLEAGRLDADRPEEEESEDVELSKLLCDCAGTVCMNYRVPAETIQLHLQPCEVCGRRVDFDILFRNLLDNAVKYAGSPPKVEVWAQPSSGDRVAVRIVDNGRGVPYHLRRKIFGRFVRLGLELEREKPGTGLGLYIVRTLARRYGGRVRVRDPERGPGSVFEVQLPGRAPLAAAEENKS
ncbi:MAG: HAMP domain-containing sensor histidine kinase [Thermoguttaceae bacterium]